jgi:hypothetical protein
VFNAHLLTYPSITSSSFISSRLLFLHLLSYCYSLTPSFASVGTSVAPFTLKVKIPGEKWLVMMPCNNPDETFHQFLVRVQAKHSTAKDCKIVLNGNEEVMYTPGATLHSVLVSEATVVHDHNTFLFS